MLPAPLSRTPLLPAPAAALLALLAGTAAAPAAPSALVTLEAQEGEGQAVLRLGGTEPIGRHVAWAADERRFVVELEGVSDSLLPPEVVLDGRRLEGACTEILERDGRRVARLELAHSPGTRVRAAVDPEDPRTLRVAVLDDGLAAPGPPGVATLASFGPRAVAGALAATVSTALPPAVQVAPPPVPATSLLARAAPVAVHAPGFAPAIGETYGLLGAPHTRFGREWDALGPRTSARRAPVAPEPVAPVESTIAAATPPPAAPAPSTPAPAARPEPVAPAESAVEESLSAPVATEAPVRAEAAEPEAAEPEAAEPEAAEPEAAEPEPDAPESAAPSPAPPEELQGAEPTAIPAAREGALDAHLPERDPDAPEDETRPDVPPELLGADDGSTRLRAIEASPMGDGRVLVLLEGDGELGGEVRLEAAPPRLRLELPGVRNAVRLARGPLAPSPLTGYRIRQAGAEDEPHLVVTLDLERLAPYELVQGLDGLAVILGRRPPAEVPARAEPAADGAAASSAGTRGGSSPKPAARPAAPPPAARPSPLEASSLEAYGSVTIADDREHWVGEPISLDLKDAELSDLFRLFSRVSGLNVIVHSSLRDRTLSLTLRDVPWDQALALILESEGLGKKLDGNVLRIAPMNLLLQEETAKANLNTARELAGQTRSIVRTLSYASGSEAESLVRRSLSSRGKSMLDRRTNTLIISDIDPRVREIEELLDLLDRPTRQVEISARIVETTKDFSKSSGIRWGLSYVADRAFGNSTDFAFPRGTNVDYAVNLPVSSSTGTLGLSFRNVLNTFALDVAIQAAEQRGRARVISQPHVVVLENRSAEIESGVQIPIIGTTAEDIEVTFVSASLRLQVEPRITQDGHVIMDVSVENNQPVFIQTVGDNASIATRRATTTVSVPSGGTTVIGGIYQSNEGASSARVPGLSRVPLLGWLFRSKQQDVTHDELLIFITPRVLDR